MPRKRSSQVRGRQIRTKINSDGAPLLCKQDEDDILIEFGHITKQPKYSFEDLKKANQVDKTTVLKLMELIVIVSRSTWTELSHRNKINLGGYEGLSISEFNSKVWEQYPEELTNDVKLYSFRFGNEDKYRMIAYKSPYCRRVLHILGFDLDFSLYDHGS